MPVKRLHGVIRSACGARINMDDQLLLLTVEECARRLALGRSHTFKYVLTGELPSVKLGRARRVPVRALEEFVDRLLQEQAPEEG